MKIGTLIAGLIITTAMSFGQTSQDQSTPVQAAGDQSGSANLKGIETPSPLTISHSLSFGMASGMGSGSLQSQSFYSTMLQYKFAAPVTLNLNFSLPLYSSFSPYQNLSAQNFQSMNYFKTIPFDVGLSWKPSDRLLFNFAVVNYPGAGNGCGMNGLGLMPWDSWGAHR